MNRTPRRITIPLLVPTLLLALAAVPARAQDAARPQLVDRVVAVVGDSMILQSELEEEILTRFAAIGRPLPPREDTAAWRSLMRQALDERISELLFVQAALRDSITAPEEEVQRRADADIAQRQRMMGGEAAFANALAQQRLTLAEYRDMVVRGLRRQALIEQYIGSLQRQRRPPPVTEDEVRAFFAAQKDVLGRRPASLTFEQVVVAPQPSDSARTAARERALEILRELREGADFAALARRHSDDPGTREQGGDLGWFRRGDMVPQFDSAAFALRPGELSGVVESAFGFHIIRVDRVRGAERQARHILIRPDLTDADLERAPEIARQVAERARAGESMKALAEQFGAPDEQVRVEVARNQLPSPYDTELANAEPGSVIGPFRLPGRGGPDRWAVVKVLEVVPEGEYSLDDPRVHALIRQQLEQQKLLDEVLEELRRRMHVEVRL
ncbi:MAG TPA: peptidylprolyl isomerase [Longimicrobiales bacterium]